MNDIHPKPRRHYHAHGTARMEALEGSRSRPSGRGFSVMPSTSSWRSSSGRRSKSRGAITYFMRIASISNGISTNPATSSSSCSISARPTTSATAKLQASGSRVSGLSHLPANAWGPGSPPNAPSATAPLSSKQVSASSNSSGTATACAPRTGWPKPSLWMSGSRHNSDNTL